VAVVGANGFLGGALVTALRETGREVIPFTRDEPFLRGSRMSPGLAESTAVFHVASSIVPATAEDHPDAAVDDLRLFDDLLRCVRAAGSSPLVVLPSSGGRVYDVAAAPPHAEDAPVGPRDRYGTTKLALESRLLAARDACRPAVLRIGNAYGPGQTARRQHGVVAHWFEAAAAGRPINLFGDPGAARDYVYVDDVVAAFLSLLERPRTPSVVNIGSGTPTSLAELAELVAGVVGDVEIDSVPGRPVDFYRTWLDISRARQALGWEPAVGLEEGLSRTWTHTRQAAA
jgi:UDP-glucose 4-epimerase